MPSDEQLPEFIAPMLAKPGQPFDSDEFLFEIKWDGTRALAYIDSDGYRLINRHHNETTHRYPEFSFLPQCLPAGTIVDGEVVVLDEEGKPCFSLMQVRDRAQKPLRIRNVARSHPATYVVFDVLYHQFESTMQQPLRQRRQLLQQLIGDSDSPQMVMSDGVCGPGKQFFEQVVAQELEGVVAKKLTSRYLPGRRSDHWIKIKKRNRILCVVFGFVPEGNDLESLLLAANTEDGFRYVGRVGTGMADKTRDELLKRFKEIPADEPLVNCGNRKAKWLEPVLYCEVRYLEMSVNGELRDPVLERFVE